MTHRIVACDDESHITRAVSMKLSRAGFTVETAADGQFGWEAIRREPPALLITDYQMPRLDGLGLIRRLREDPATREIPVILLTAKGYELNHDELIRELQLTAIMVKPFSPRDLLEKVREILNSASVA